MSSVTSSCETQKKQIMDDHDDPVETYFWSLLFGDPPILRNHHVYLYISDYICISIYRFTVFFWISKKLHLCHTDWVQRLGRVDLPVDFQEIWGRAPKRSDRKNLGLRLNYGFYKVFTWIYRFRAKKIDTFKNSTKTLNTLIGF